MVATQHHGTYSVYRASSRNTYHQKSSTVSNVYTDLREEPYLSSDCLALGLSNHKHHLCCRGCFFEKSGSCLSISPSSLSMVLQGAIVTRTFTEGAAKYSTVGLKSICVMQTGHHVWPLLCIRVVRCYQESSEGRVAMTVLQQTGTYTSRDR